MRHTHTHKHSHSHLRRKLPKNWICPIHDQCVKKTVFPEHGQCPHSKPHRFTGYCEIENHNTLSLKNEENKCPMCIKTKEVINEETFTEEEFIL